jgi:hypothetical protein
MTIISGRKHGLLALRRITWAKSQDVNWAIASVVAAYANKSDDRDTIRRLTAP